LTENDSGDGRRRGGRRTAAATAMPASWWVGRPMRVHGSVPGVRVEAKVELGLEQRRWMAGRTGELGAAATADAGERRGEAPEQCEGGGVAWGVGGA
jgi:hypothetical protein